MRALVLFFFCLINFSSNASTIKIGFIDTNQVVSSLTLYKQSIDSIAREFEPKKQELLDLFNHIELLRTKINNINKTSNNESIEAELLKLSNLEMSFKQETEFWQKTMDNKKIELLNEIELIINQAINEYATKEQFDLILYENVAFSSDKVNITDNIIELIENQK
jgi:outer membrane protein